MTCGRLYIDLLAHEVGEPPSGRLESRLTEFLETMPDTESLGDVAFSKINGAEQKADYLLSGRRLIAELKTVNGDPTGRIEQRLKTRLQRSDAPIVFGTVGVNKVIEGLSDRVALDKMMTDLAGRAVRRHLHKANAQIGAIKERLSLSDVGGLLILMNDAEPKIDAGAIGYALKTAFEAPEGSYEHVTNVWAIVESHRIALPNGRTGYPHLHLFKSLERRSELGVIADMLAGWAKKNGSNIERLQHHGDWNAMAPIYDGRAPTLSPY
ncbi:MAG TPA: hypothetical protein VGC35_05855 [Allosphingosinicella sp.]|jgi:hypothetical protein